MATTTDAPATGLLNLEKDLICFICTEVLYQPLTLIDCLHTFCGSCLKEWFSHQHRKANHSHTPPNNPYTCPTCRATVKDARRNGMINTLLDMYLSANPARNRSTEEREEMGKVYKPGDDILPKVEPKRRRRRDDDEVARRERIMLDEARERSMRDTRRAPAQAPDRLTPGDARQRSRSHEHDERRDRRIQERQERQERRERRDRVGSTEVALRDRSRDQQNHTTQSSRSPPPTSPRHPDAVEARQRARTVAHQASLRSIASASDGSGTGDSVTEAQLMQEIISEGLLDGIDVDNLTEAEQDALSEVIAERYRQLHPRRGQRSALAIDESSNEPLNMVMEALQIEEADRRPRHSSQGNPRRPEESPRSAFTSTRDGSRHSPASPPSELSPPAQRVHHRRASDQSGRQTSGQVSRQAHPSARNPATRSATDVSDQTPPNDATEPTQRLSFEQRSQIEPRQSSKASEQWQRQGTAQSRQIRIAGPSVDTTKARAALEKTAPQASTLSRPGPSSIPRSVPADPEVDEIATASMQASFEEPSVTCYRCSRSGIQYEVYKHCYPCGVDLCQRCYRSGRGCDHWFGFGHGAISRFDASHPQNRGTQAMELPHMLVGRQYREPPAGATQTKEPLSNTSIITSSDPSNRLQEGHFCDRCGSFANACFWSCDVCNEGEWGFCNDCVNTHHCCSHPLLPVAHKSFGPASHQAGYDPHTGNITLTPADLHASILRSSPAHSAPSSATSATDVSRGPRPDFVNLTITTHCDICTQPIPPSNSRYHCPFHPSPTPLQPTSVGDYDICTSCYHNLVKIGRIKRDDGPAGWRKCPNGHRMIVTAFEADVDAEQRRTIVRDLVGGAKMTEEDIQAWSASMVKGTTSSSPPQAKVREWTWHDPADPASDPNTPPVSHRRIRSRQATITPENGSGTSKFPPDGGLGKMCVALWSYYPEEGEEGKGELLFPKRAELREVEEINEEWSEGVYAGERGLVPRVYIEEQ